MASGREKVTGGMNGYNIELDGNFPGMISERCTDHEQEKTALRMYQNHV